MSRDEQLLAAVRVRLREIVAESCNLPLKQGVGEGTILKPDDFEVKVEPYGDDWGSGDALRGEELLDVYCCSVGEDQSGRMLVMVDWDDVREAGPGEGIMWVMYMFDGMWSCIYNSTLGMGKGMVKWDKGFSVSVA